MVDLPIQNNTNSRDMLKTLRPLTLGAFRKVCVQKYKIKTDQSVHNSWVGNSRFV